MSEPVRACKEFKPIVTNPDVCRFWERHIWDRMPIRSSPDQHFLHYSDRDFLGDPEPVPPAKCKRGLECPTAGQRPERLDQESDSEE